MGWDGAGGYNRQRNFSADASAGIKILASAMDQEIDDVASAMQLCWARDGQNTPTGNIPMGGYRFTNVGNAASVSDYITAKQVIENVPIYVEDTNTSADKVSVSATFFTSVSAGQAPAGGTKIMARTLSHKSAPVMYFSGHSANINFHGGPRIDGLVSGAVYELTYSSAGSVWETGADRLYPRTAAETAAGVTVVNFNYPEHHVYRYGTNTTPGTTDMATAIQAALDVGTNAQVIQLPDEHMLVGTKLTIRVGGGMIGKGEEATRLIINHDGDAIEATDARFIVLKRFTIFDNISGTRTTGAGIHLNDAGGGTNCDIEHINVNSMWNALKITGGQIGSSYKNVRSNTALNDAFTSEGASTYCLWERCYANDPAGDGFVFTKNHTYCTILAPACDTPGTAGAGIGYKFLGTIADGHQVGITIINPACEAGADTDVCLQITQARHITVICPEFTAPTGNVIELAGNASWTTTNITFINGRAVSSTGGYGITIDANCSRIRAEGLDLGGNSSGRVDNADRLTEFLPPDGNDAYEFRRPVLLGHTVATNTSIGDVVAKNLRGLRGVNNAGTDTVALVDIDDSDRVRIAGAGGDIRWGTALIALGGGSSATLGTIGGSGPATAGQNTWMRVIDSTGAAFWVPAWK